MSCTGNGVYNESISLGTPIFVLSYCDTFVNKVTYVRVIFTADSRSGNICIFPGVNVDYFVQFFKNTRRGFVCKDLYERSFKTTCVHQMDDLWPRCQVGCLQHVDSSCHKVTQKMYSHLITPCGQMAEKLEVFPPLTPTRPHRNMKT